MPIDSYTVADTAGSKKFQFTVVGYPNHASSLCMALNTSLEEAGWGSTPIAAKAALQWSGIPTTFVRDPPVPEEEKELIEDGGRSFVIGFSVFFFYDPETHKVAAGSGGIALGYTEEETLQSFNGVVTAGSDWSVITEDLGPWKESIFTAKVPGPEMNGTRLWLYMNYNVGGVWINSYHGGYKLISAFANGRTQYQVEIYAEDAGQHWFPDDEFAVPGQLTIKVIAINGDTEYTVLHSMSAQLGEYVLMANAYQFLLESMNQGASFGNYNNTFFVCAPCVTLREGGGYHGVDCVFVLAKMAGFSWQNDAAPTNSLHWRRSSLSVENGEWFTYEGFERDAGHPGLILHRYPGEGGLLTPEDKPLMTNAWVAFSYSRTEPVKIVGKIWDAFCTSYSRQFAAAFLRDDKQWREVFRQSGYNGATRGSLWMTYE